MVTAVTVTKTIHRNFLLENRKRIIKCGVFPHFFSNFAKNTAHIERCLKINAYICTVAENLRQS